MRKAIQIKASILLSIFSLFLVHQIVPHLHHEHLSDNTVAHSHVESYHGHKHEEPSNKEDKKSELQFLEFFIKMHSHGKSDIFEHLQNYIVVKKQKTLDIEVLVSNAFIKNLKQQNIGFKNKIQSYNAPELKHNSHLIKLDLRGPPFFS